jgi:hypothetical protein
MRVNPLHPVKLLFADAAERRDQAIVTLLMLFALGFIVPWWAVLLAGAASFTLIILRPSVRTLELMKAKDKGALATGGDELQGEHTAIPDRTGPRVGSSTTARS